MYAYYMLLLNAWVLLVLKTGREVYERYQAVKFYKSPPKDKAQHDPPLACKYQHPWGLCEECNMFSIVGDFDSKLVKNDFSTPFLNASFGNGWLPNLISLLKW